MDKILEKYKEQITGIDFTNSQALDLTGLVMDKKGPLEVIYAPFDYINTAAKLVIVGITPGKYQAIEGLKAIKPLLSIIPHAKSLEKVKSIASFSGPLRKNLVEMLDEVGLHSKLGILSSSELFDSKTELVHFTSVLRYPVFIEGKDYSGSPSFLTNELLLEQFTKFTAKELQAFPNDTLFLPLGKVPEQAMKHLIEKKLLDENQVLFGLPHPSGANAERISYFLGKKCAGDCSSKTNPLKIDAQKSQLLKKINGAIPSSRSVNTAATGKEPVTLGHVSEQHSKDVIKNTKVRYIKTGKGKNLRSNESKFILASVEHEILTLVEQARFNALDIKSPTSKEIAVTNNGEVVAYISRITGLTKGCLHISLPPEKASLFDPLFSKEAAINPNPNKKWNSRFVASSNYRGFNSAGYCPELQSKEPVAASYIVDVNSGFESLVNALNVIKENS